MAVKFYSDVTKKFYDSEQAASEEEAALKKTQDEKMAKNKALAEEVEQKRQALNKAREEYNNVLNEFCKQYGAYHYTISPKDLEKEMTKSLYSLFGW